MKEEKKLSELTNEELLQVAKKRKATTIMNAVFIGFLAGIIMYSVMKSTWGLVTLIPLFLIYKLLNSSKHDHKELEQLLKERNLN